MRSLWAILLLLLASCAVEPPRRPVVEAGAPLGVVEPALLVGVWECRDLNPYPGQPDQVVVSTYDADGSFVDRSLVPGPPGLGGMMEVTVRGRWAVEGGRLVTREARAEARAVEGEARLGQIAALGAEFLNSRPAHERDTVAEVLRLDAGELVLRPVGPEDPAIVRCTR